jgi:hypothetical protein
MKKVYIGISVLMVLFFLCTGVHAATMTIDINGLDATTPVEGFTIWLDVGDGFTLDSVATIGDAIPAAVGGYGWAEDNFDIMGSQLKMGFSDWDNLMFDMDNPLVDGTMLTFNYTGSIDGLALAQMFTGSATDLYNNGITLGTFSATNINFQGPAAIPIPGALWLLGSGLIGMVGIRRKLGKA